MLTHGSLFSGIGGFDLAAAWAGIPTLWQVERDLFCRMVLKKHFPETKQYEEIKGLTGLQPVSIISGGFPCQPFSLAGNKRGKEDDRYLWVEMFHVIKEVRPRWCIVENVPGIISVALDDCIAALESEGYSVGTVILPACSQNAPHRRDRVFIIANISDTGIDATRSAQSRNCQRESADFRERTTLGNDAGNGGEDVGNATRFGRNESSAEGATERQCEITAGVSGGAGIFCNAESHGSQEPTNWVEQGKRSTGADWWQSEPAVGRVVARVPNRVDRLKSLGNAVVPQVAFRIFEAIKEIENAE